MIATLIWRDLRQHWAVWAWTSLVALVGSAGIAAIAVVATAAWRAARTPEQEVMVQSVTGNVVAYTLLAGCAVVASTAGLAVSSRARDYAIWKTVGVPTRTLTVVVRGQLAVAGLIGGSLGVPVVAPMARWVAEQWTMLGALPDSAPLPWGWTIATPAIGSLLCLLGGWPATVRAGRTSEMEALREAAAPTARVGVLRRMAAGVIVVGLVALPLTTLDALREVNDLRDMPPVPGYVLGFAISTLLMMLALVLAPWTLRAAVLALTAMPVPGTAWRVAGKTARLRASTGTTMTFPFALSMAVSAVGLGAGNLVSGEVDVAEITVAFGLVFLVCWVGGVANIALLGRRRSRDTALLAVTGGRPCVVTATTVLEGVLHAGAAWLFSLVLAVTAILITGFTAGMAPWNALARGPWELLGVMGIATLGTCVAAVVVPAVVQARRPALERLRVTG